MPWNEPNAGNPGNAQPVDPGLIEPVKPVEPVTLESTELELAKFRRLTLQQQALIHQLRGECKRLRTLRIRIVSGELSDLVDMEHELGKEKEFLPSADERWAGIVEKLERAAKKDPDAAAVLKELVGDATVPIDIPKG